MTLLSQTSVRPTHQTSQNLFASSKYVPHPANPSLPPFIETQAKQIPHPATGSPQKVPRCPNTKHVSLNHMPQHSQQGGEGLEVWPSSASSFLISYWGPLWPHIQQKGTGDHCANLVCSQQKRKEVQKGKWECPGLHTQASTDSGHTTRQGCDLT